MEAHSLRTPSTDGGLLAVPPLSEAARVLEENAGRLSGWDHDFQGRRASRLRPAVRGQAIGLARKFMVAAGLSADRFDSAPESPPRLIVTGHQPELFHPGVWVKNFAAGATAAETGAVALNLIVDNDVPKGVGIRVPEEEGGRLRSRRVEFDVWQGDVPYEDTRVADERVFQTFADRVREVLPRGILDPLIESFWPRALASREFTDRSGLRFAAARHGVEAAWGLKNLEVPLSTLCESDGFLWFACHLLAELPRFSRVHNEALRNYRELYGIRSKNHPVPALGVQGDWSEAPFWVWRATAPRRRPLMVRQLARTMELRIGGEDAPFLEIPLSADREACCAVDQLATLPSRGVRLRTRALTTTMFARSLLGDLFLHGIGGAKYDELGDEIGRRFFGFEPPAFMTLSMTLRLGLGNDPGASDRLAAVERSLRDLDFNPDRHLQGPSGSEAERWVEAKRAAIAGPVETHTQRVERFREIRRCNAALQGEVEGVRRELLADRDRLVATVRRNAVARSREYSIVLHSADNLRDAIGRAVAGPGRPPGAPESA